MQIQWNQRWKARRSSEKRKNWFDRPWESRIPAVTLLLFAILGVFLSILSFKVFSHFIPDTIEYQVQGRRFYPTVGLWMISGLLAQTTIRGFFWRRRPIRQHLFDGWVLSTTAIWLMTGSVLMLLGGHWQGLVVFGLGGWLLWYRLRRPAVPNWPLLKFENPISSPGAWIRVWSWNRYLPYTLGILLFGTWLFPWGLLSEFSWHQTLVTWLEPHLPNLSAMRERSLFPDYGIGMISIYGLILPATLLISLAQIQVADKVAEGSYELHYAWRWLIIALIGLISFFLLFPKYLTTDTRLASLTRQNTFVFAVFHTLWLFYLNMCFLYTAAIGIGLLQRAKNQLNQQTNSITDKGQQ